MTRSRYRAQLAMSILRYKLRPVNANTMSHPDALHTVRTAACGTEVQGCQAHAPAAIPMMCGDALVDKTHTGNELEGEPGRRRALGRGHRTRDGVDATRRVVSCGTCRVARAVNVMFVSEQHARGTGLYKVSLCRGKWCSVPPATRIMSTIPRPRKVSRRLIVYLDETECLASQMGLTKSEADRELYREILVCLSDMVVSVTRRPHSSITYVLAAIEDCRNALRPLLPAPKRNAGPLAIKGSADRRGISIDISLTSASLTLRPTTLIQAVRIHPVLKTYEDSWPISTMVLLHRQFRKNGHPTGIVNCGSVVRLHLSEALTMYIDATSPGLVSPGTAERRPVDLLPRRHRKMVTARLL